MKTNSTSSQLEVDGSHLVEPSETANEFTKHFQPVYNDPCSGVFPSILFTSEYVSSPPSSSSDVSEALKRLRPSKSVGIYGIPSLLIRIFRYLCTCSKHSFNLTLSQQCFILYGSKWQMFQFS
jgi:hypothetical protein